MPPEGIFASFILVNTSSSVFKITCDVTEKFIRTIDVASYSSLPSDFKIDYIIFPEFSPCILLPQSLRKRTHSILPIDTVTYSMLVYSCLVYCYIVIAHNCQVCSVVVLPLQKKKKNQYQPQSSSVDLLEYCKIRRCV
jgi:hypothetical protein